MEGLGAGAVVVEESEEGSSGSGSSSGWELGMSSISSSVSTCVGLGSDGGVETRSTACVMILRMSSSARRSRTNTLRGGWYGRSRDDADDLPTSTDQCPC